VTGLGVGFSLLGGLLADSGLEEAGETISWIGNLLMMAGSAVSAIIPIISALGLTVSSAGVQMTIACTAVQIAWWPLILIFLGVAAAIGAIVAICAYLESVSPEKKLEKAQNAANEAANAA
jgi:hypothetical protein